MNERGSNKRKRFYPFFISYNLDTREAFFFTSRRTDASFIFRCPWMSTAGADTCFICLETLTSRVNLPDGSICDLDCIRDWPETYGCPLNKTVPFRVKDLVCTERKAVAAPHQSRITNRQQPAKWVRRTCGFCRAEAEVVESRTRFECQMCRRTQDVPPPKFPCNKCKRMFTRFELGMFSICDACT